nr:hypothetical protein [Natrinema hispanicum]
MLIQAANAVSHVRDADAFHVDASLEGIDWNAVVDEMDDLLGGIAADMERRSESKLPSRSSRNEPSSSTNGRSNSTDRP